MIDLIQGFVERLRRLGVVVSPAEGIEAARAVSVLGIESRPAVKAALRATLAKTLVSQQLFDDAFEAYFSPPRPGGRRGRREEEGGSGGGGGGSGSGAGRTASRPAPEREEGRARPGSPPARFRISPARPRRPKAGASPPVRPASLDPSARRGGGRRPRFLLDRRGDRGGEVRRAEGAPRPDPAVGSSAITRRDLRGFVTTEEERLLARRVPAIVEAIRLKPGRRFRRGPRGRLWLKRVIRESLSRGGVPFTLPMKRRRPKRPRVVLLVDVSHSVARAAAYFLLICRGLAARLPRVEIFLFVDRLAGATLPLRRWSGSPSSLAPFREILKGIPDLELGAPSDYGRVFFQARSALAPSGGAGTLLVVLGDARANGRDPLAWAFEEIAARCRRVIWLNPEAHALWDSGDSVMAAYAPSCDVVCEARDLEGLARGVREILRGL